MVVSTGDGDSFAFAVAFDWSVAVVVIYPTASLCSLVLPRDEKAQACAYHYIMQLLLQRVAASLGSLVLPRDEKACHYFSMQVERSGHQRFGLAYIFVLHGQKQYHMVFLVCNKSYLDSIRGRYPPCRCVSYSYSCM